MSGGRYTYYRKKRLDKRKSGSLSQFVTSRGAGSQKQCSVDKSKKQDSSGDVPENAKHGMSVLNTKEIRLAKSCSESHKNYSSSHVSSNKKLEKVAAVAKGILVFLDYMFCLSIDCGDVPS